MKFLAKSSLFHIPFIGWGMKIAGDISLRRGSTQSARQAMAQAARYVAAGMPVLFFPEGTRSRDGELLPFKDGAFRLAIEQKAAVLPIAISGTATALRKGDWKPSTAHGTCLVGAPIFTDGLKAEDLSELKDRTRRAIEELKRELRARGL
jgi:1-acyl-sn-glycerol-3-phosphate acyltransferase